MVRKSPATFEDIATAVRPCLAARPEIVFAYVFGSTARGEGRPDSDVDIAVFLDDSVSAPGYTGYRAALTTELLRCLTRNDVDLVVLNQSPVLLTHRIVRDGLVVLSRDEAKRVTFVTDTGRRYCDSAYLRRVAAEYMRKSLQNGTFGKDVRYRTVLE
jgi:hypothetical protein